MEDSPQSLTKLTKSSISIEYNKSLILELCVIFYGQTLKMIINKVMGHRPEAQATFGAPM